MNIHIYICVYNINDKRGHERETETRGKWKGLEVAKGKEELSSYIK